MAHGEKGAAYVALPQMVTTCSRVCAQRTATSSSSTTRASEAGDSSCSGVIAMADDNAKTAVDVEMCGSLKVGGGAAHDCVASNGDDVIGALCARDHKGVGSQYVDEGKVILSWESR